MKSLLICFLLTPYLFGSPLTEFLSKNSHPTLSKNYLLSHKGKPLLNEFSKIVKNSEIIELHKNKNLATLMPEIHYFEAYYKVLTDTPTSTLQIVESELSKWKDSGVLVYFIKARSIIYWNSIHKTKVNKSISKSELINALINEQSVYSHFFNNKKYAEAVIASEMGQNKTTTGSNLATLIALSEDPNIYLELINKIISHVKNDELKEIVITVNNFVSKNEKKTHDFNTALLFMPNINKLIKIHSEATGIKIIKSK